jgi:hypothetical protein
LELVSEWLYEPIHSDSVIVAPSDTTSHSTKLYREAPRAKYKRTVVSGT